MGMFDTWEIFSSHFKENQLFNLEAVKPGPMLTTEYGEQQPALLKIDGKWYSIFGAAILAQVRRADSDDFPMSVRVARVASNKGNDMKILVPEGMEPEQFMSAQKKARGEAVNNADFERTGKSDVADDDIPF
jgi:hypothetical protein